jgi:VWFA-related protein
MSKIRTEKKVSVAAVIFIFSAISGTLAPLRTAAASAGGPRAGYRGDYQNQKDREGTIKLTSDLVSLNVSAIGRDGRPLKSLSKDHFTVYEDGVKQTITHFAAVEEPFTLMLLLDISGSTAEQILLMKRAAKGFLAELRPRDRIGVIVFSRRVETIADFSRSRQEVSRQIDNIATTEGYEDQRFTADTGTSFYDALYYAAGESSLKRVEGRKAIICMSDGVDSTSRLQYSDIASVVENSSASVYFLEWDTEDANLDLVSRDPSDPQYANFSQSQLDRYFTHFDPDPDSENRLLPRNALPPDLRAQINRGLYEIAGQEIGQAAERTGGRVYPVRGLEDLAGVFKQVAAALRIQYSIGYYSTNPLHDGKWRTVRVGISLLGAVVRTRSGYRAPNR